MTVKARLLTLVTALLASSFVGAQAQQATSLYVKNKSSQNGVEVCLTLPASSTCGSQTISQFQYSINGGQPQSLTQISNLQGWFQLNAKQKAHITSTTGNCMGGVNISFLAPPQCPSASGTKGFTKGVEGPSLPNGVNQAEVVLNPPSPGQEAVDISCNTGANCKIELSTWGGPYWGLPGGSSAAAINIGNKSVDIANKIDNNCNLLGVMAYNLSTCNAGPDSCSTPSGAFCTTSNHDVCIVQRSAVNGGFGGTVTVSYLGQFGGTSAKSKAHQKAQ